jgi:hypothetical protein
MILKQKVLHGELRNLKVGREKSVSFITLRVEARSVGAVSEELRA